MYMYIYKLYTSWHMILRLKRNAMCEFVRLHIFLVEHPLCHCHNTMLQPFSSSPYLSAARQKHLLGCGATKDHESWTSSEQDARPSTKNAVLLWLRTYSSTRLHCVLRMLVVFPVVCFVALWVLTQNTLFKATKANNEAQPHRLPYCTIPSSTRKYALQLIWKYISFTVSNQQIARGKKNY